MYIALLRRIAVASGIVLTPMACSGGARQAATPAGPPPEVVKQLQVPDSPYFLIYSPPADLAKAPDKTTPGRKPRS